MFMFIYCSYNFLELAVQAIFITFEFFFTPVNFYNRILIRPVGILSGFFQDFKCLPYQF